MTPLRRSCACCAGPSRILPGSFVGIVFSSARLEFSSFRASRLGQRLHEAEKHHFHFQRLPRPGMVGIDHYYLAIHLQDTYPAMPALPVPEANELSGLKRCLLGEALARPTMYPRGVR